MPSIGGEKAALLWLVWEGRPEIFGGVDGRDTKTGVSRGGERSSTACPAGTDGFLSHCNSLKKP